MRVPYPDLTVSLARATTAFANGFFSAVCWEGVIARHGFGFERADSGASSSVADLRNALELEAR